MVNGVVLVSLKMELNLFGNSAMNRGTNIIQL